MRLERRQLDGARDAGPGHDHFDAALDQLARERFDARPCLVVLYEEERRNSGE